MIVSKKHKFVFLKTPKTGGSSLEFYLSQFCDKNDIITPLLPREENLKKKLNLLNSRNYKIKKFAFGNFKKLKILKTINLYDHASLKILENEIRINLKKYYIFAFVRNPYDWIVSFFLWQLHFYETFKLEKINKFNKKEINLLFRLFLTTKSPSLFHEIKQIISSKKYKVNVFKYEELKKKIFHLKNIFKFNNEKVKIDEVKLKFSSINPNIKKKIKFTKEDIQLVKREAKYIFDRYNYSKIIPKKYVE